MYKYTIFQPDPFPTKSGTFDKTNVQWMSSTRVRNRQKAEIEKIKSMIVYKYTILISAHAISQGGEFDKAYYCGLGTQEFESPR